MDHRDRAVLALRRGLGQPAVEGHVVGHAARPRIRHVRLHLVRRHPGASDRGAYENAACSADWQDALPCCPLRTRHTSIATPAAPPPPARHFFYNSLELDFLVAIQAGLTVVGNATCWIAAYRIYTAAKAEQGA
jgi:hypothetical protein